MRRPRTRPALLARIEAGAREGDEITRAAVYGALGDTGRALDLVELGVKSRSATAIFLAVDPLRDSLRHSGCAARDENGIPAARRMTL